MPDNRFAITFDGQTIPFTSGQTIAAALIAAGRPSWRTTRHRAEPRGLFCGIGACFDCLVTLNGVPGLRACLVTAEPGDVVSTEQGAGRDELAL